MSFHFIIDPDSLKSYSIFSEKGLSMLKNYVREFQEGGSEEQSNIPADSTSPTKPADSTPSVDNDNANANGSLTATTVEDGENSPIESPVFSECHETPFEIDGGKIHVCVKQDNQDDQDDQETAPDGSDDEDAETTATTLTYGSDNDNENENENEN